MSKAILYDATLCINCKLCERGCAERPEGEPRERHARKIGSSVSSRSV